MSLSIGEQTNCSCPWVPEGLVPVLPCERRSSSDGVLQRRTTNHKSQVARGLLDARVARLQIREVSRCSLMLAHRAGAAGCMSMLSKSAIQLHGHDDGRVDLQPA